MGASPKTKAEYRNAIAKKQGELENLKVMLANAKQSEKLAKKNGYVVSHGPNYVLGLIANVKSEIAKLKSEMANAPK